MNEGPIFTHLISGSDHVPGPGSTQKLFPYWSFTKTAIAICAMKLAEQGQLDLDAHLPDADYALRHLLTHSTGLPEYCSLPAYHDAVTANQEPWPAPRLIDATMALGRLFPTGKAWEYSNLGYLLARLRIEDAASAPLSELIQDLICDPLGLNSVKLATTREQFAQCYWEGAQRYHPNWVYHGCLIGTAADAARLLHGLYGGHLLSPTSLSDMSVPIPLGGGIDGRPWTETGYACGLMSGRAGDLGRMVGHSGVGPFCTNAVYHCPDLNKPVTVACFASGADETVVEWAVVDCLKQLG